MNRVCANCQKCKQFFTDDFYPEFACKDGNNFKEDFMGYPSNTEGCELWEQNTRKFWTE